jgi:hypothetical protein
MNQASTSSLPVAHEPIPAVAVSVLNPSWLAPDVSVSALPFALTTKSLRRANRKRGNLGIQRAVCGTKASHLLRDAGPHEVSVLTRAATFSWNGVAAAPVVARNVDINVMEVG